MTLPLEKALKIQKALRQKCRTDLLALCDVLGYRDVNRKVHGPLLDGLQKFKGGVDEERDGKLYYEPAVPMFALEGSRRNLFLYPRGHLKTTILTIAHTIQWVINYPDVRVLISMATGDQAEMTLKAIKEHFQFNVNFRALFPEFCPPAQKSADFGSRDEFTVPNRKLIRREPTVWTCSVGKVIAGVHPDVIKNSDLVDKENVKTPGGIKDVIQHFKHLNPLLERYNEADFGGKHYDASTGWNDVEGTRYDFGDLYGSLLKQADWKDQAIIRPAHGENYSDILWPERFSKQILEQALREMGDWEYSAQYLNKCVPAGDGLCDPKDVAFVPEAAVLAMLPRLRKHCTIDLAGMEQTRAGDYTVLNVSGFDGRGHMIVIKLLCGHYTPEEVIDLIFSLHKQYGCDFKIEKEAHARVLLPFLKREMSVRSIYPIVYELKRDTHTSKQHRIRGLRPWFKGGKIMFSDGIDPNTKVELMDEIGQFPSQSSGVHDDILDTLADQMQSEDGGVNYDVVSDPMDLKTAFFGVPRPPGRFMGFGETGQPMWNYDEEVGTAISKTGFLD